MNEKDISVLLKKADELRSLFVLGQRVVPFLEEIFVFVRDIQPMLKEISFSINENLKKMPGASEKLSKVTEANELATTEIMDIVDNLFGKVESINSNRNDIRKHYKKIVEKPLRLLEIVHKGIQQGSDLNEILPQLAQSIETLNSYSEENIEVYEEKNNEILESIINDASSIMMSLQVQDITAQQIAAVDHMLRTIQTKMSGILKHFAQTDIATLARNIDEEDETENITHFHRDIAFDPNAIDSISKKATRQSDVDDLLKSHAENTLEEENVVDDNDESVGEDIVSADDIDAMFSSQGSEEVGVKSVEEDIASADDIDAMFSLQGSEEEGTESEEDEVASADDIDAMFDSQRAEYESDDSDEDGPASADDIDAMFAK